MTRAVRGLEVWHNYGSQQLYFSFYRNLSRKKKASAGQKSHIKLVCRVLTYWDFYAAILKPIWARPSFPPSHHIVSSSSSSENPSLNVVFPSHLKPTQGIQQENGGPQKRSLIEKNRAFAYLGDHLKAFNDLKRSKNQFRFAVAARKTDFEAGILYIQLFAWGNYDRWTWAPFNDR